MRVCMCTVYMVPAFHSSGQRICCSTSLGVTALSSQITSGFTDIVTPLILFHCARGPAISPVSHVPFFPPTALSSLSHHYNFQLFHCHPFVNVYLHIPQEICPIILHHDALSPGPGFSTIFLYRPLVNLAVVHAYRCLSPLDFYCLRSFQSINCFVKHCSVVMD